MMDTFEAKTRIGTIDNALFNQKYQYVSISHRIKENNATKTDTRIRDICKKTIFGCDGIYYEQINGVSMGGSLGPVLANIIPT